jgi:ABC-type transport system involved in multi-copper enzyme maturation permease subunit
MRYLLRAELHVILNQFRHRENIKEFILGIVLMLCFSIGLVVTCHKVLLAPAVLQLVRDDPSGQLLRFLIGLVMMPTLLLALTLAMSQVRLDLFESPLTDLLITSPISRGSIVTWAFLRNSFSILCMSSLIEMAPLGLFLWKTTGTPLGALLFPVGAIFLVAPLVAIAVLFHVILMRWLAKPQTRMLLSILGGAAAIVFILLVAGGAMTGESSGQELAAFMETEPRLPLLLGLPADMLMGLVGLPHGQTDLFTILITLLSPCILLACAAPLYERAFENASVIFRPSLARTVRSLGRRWPTIPAASIFRRELVQLVQQPANLLGFLFLGVLIFMIARSNPLSLSYTEGAEVPEVVVSAAEVFFTWLFTGLMFASMSVSSFTADHAYLVLYKSSPIRPASLLHGRIATLLLPLGWCFFLVLLIGRWYIGASPWALVLFTGYVLPAIVITLGLISGLGTLAIPRRSGDGAPLAATARMIMMSIGVGLAMGIILGVCIGFWKALQDSYTERGALARMNPVALLLVTQAVAWAFSLLVGGLGYAFGLRNYRQLLAPEE